MKKRILSWILGLALCLSLLPAAAFAEEIDPGHTHVFDQEVAEAQYQRTPATCTEAASYAKSCVCGEASATETFTSGDALGHNWGAWVKISAEEHQRECTRCHAVEKAEHAYNGTVCAFCGYDMAPEPEATGTISITKSIGGDVLTGDITGNISFRVNSSDGAYDKTFRLGTDFVYNREKGLWTKQLVVPAGKYTVTETSPKVEGYTEKVTYKVDGGSATVGKKVEVSLAAGGEVGIAISDVYEKNVTVSFNMNGHGAAVADQKMAKGEKAVKPADPTAEGWKFGGWYKEAALTNVFDFNAAITADTTVYAKWTEIPPAPVTYTVTFKMNDHGKQVAEQKVESGKKATKPADPTEAEWKFEGWYKDEKFTAKFDFNTEIKANTTVYAKWSPVTYTVTFKMNNHGKQVAEQKVESGKKATKPADPKESGYVFKGWYKDAKFTAKFDFNTAIKANTTVYAKWVKDTSDSSAAKTGDNSHLFLWITLLIISGGVLTGTAVFRRKRR